MRSGPCRSWKRAAGCATAAIDCDTGLPVQRAPGSASGKATITWRASLASTRLASPAIEFCSCSTSGRPVSTAIMPAGNVMYPPSPSTTAGRTSRSAASDCQQARARLKGSRSTVIRPLPRRPPNCTAFISIPRPGTNLASMPAGLPSQTTRQSRSRIRSATARPGKIWPPVPPAMMRMVRVPWLTAPSPASSVGSRHRCAARSPARSRSSAPPSRRSSSAAGSGPWSAAGPDSPRG